MPMFEAFVLPTLKKLQFKVGPTLHFLRLIGVSEADIASRVDAALQGHEVETAFCWHYPYCDIAVKIKNDTEKQTIITILNNLLAPYTVSHEKKNASELVQEYLIEKQLTLFIQDSCTGGLLQAQLFSPQTRKLLVSEPGGISLIVSGLTKWLNGEAFGSDTSFEISVTGLATPFHESRSVPYRGARVRDFAVEYACFCLLKVFKNS